MVADRPSQGGGGVCQGKIYFYFWICTMLFTGQLATVWYMLTVIQLAKNCIKIQETKTKDSNHDCHDRLQNLSVTPIPWSPLLTIVKSTTDSSTHSDLHQDVRHEEKTISYHPNSMKMWEMDQKGITTTPKHNSKNPKRRSWPRTHPPIWLAPRWEMWANKRFPINRLASRCETSNKIFPIIQLSSRCEIWTYKSPIIQSLSRCGNTRKQEIHTILSNPSQLTQTHHPIWLASRWASANSGVLNFQNLDKFSTPSKYTKFSDV